MKGKNGSDVLVYDKYNRSDGYNSTVLNRCREDIPDYVVCSNVLNVIMEEDVIESVLAGIQELCGKDTVVYIAIYEGDKSGKGKETSKGWQRNEKACEYEEIISRYFGFRRKGGIFVCSRHSRVN